MKSKNSPLNKQFRGARNQQVARAGEHFVVAELNKRGAYAVSFAGNMPKIDLIASNRDQSRTIHIQVKTKSGGPSWHSSILDGKSMRKPKDSQSLTTYWIFVDIGKIGSSPRYWIVPDWWIRNNIYKTIKAYLKSHGGRRPRNPDSKHHAIEEKRLIEWKECWDILRIFK